MNLGKTVKLDEYTNITFFEDKSFLIKRGNYSSVSGAMDTLPKLIEEGKKYLKEINAKEADQLREWKCQEKGCWNYRVSDYTQCTIHLHGTPRRFTPESIAILKEAGVE